MVEDRPEPLKPGELTQQVNDAETALKKAAVSGKDEDFDEASVLVTQAGQAASRFRQGSKN